MSVLILHFLFLKLHLLTEAKKHLLHWIIVGLLSSHNGITKRFPVVSVGFIQEKLRQIFLCFFPVISYTRICISQDVNVLFLGQPTAGMLQNLLSLCIITNKYEDPVLIKAFLLAIFFYYHYYYSLLLNSVKPENYHISLYPYIHIYNQGKCLDYVMYMVPNTRMRCLTTLYSNDLNV